MSRQKEEIRDKNFTSEESSIINNPKYSKLERMALVRSMTDRLKLTLDDIRNSVNSERLDSLSIVPPDLLPFEINLADGKKITIMETNPVVTCYDGELTNVEGNIIHVYLRKEGEELVEDFIPPKKVYTVTAQTLETVLPSIIKDLLIPSPQGTKFLTIPGTSKKLDTPSNAASEDSLSCTSKIKKPDENNKDKSMALTSGPYNKISDETMPSAIDHNVEAKVFTQPEIEKNITHREHEESTCKKSKISPEDIFLTHNQPLQDNDTSPFSSKFQVIGLVDTGDFRESGSDEINQKTTEDFDKDWMQEKNTATIIVDQELDNPSDFRSVFLKTPSPVPKKKTVDVRKSSRKRKPKIRSPFKSWDDVKIIIPRNTRKAKVSKSNQVTTQNLRLKKITQKNKNDSRN